MKTVQTFFAFAGLILLMLGCSKITPEGTVTADEAIKNENMVDTLFINGKILTVDEHFRVASAIAIKGDRILAVGENDPLNDLANTDTTVIDLQGKTVIPGLIDNHIHFIRMPQRWNLQARIDGINNRQEALRVIADKAASMEPGEWLMVQGGWSENQFADQPGGFTVEELDAAAPNNPLFLQILYVRAYANSLALKAVGIDPSAGAKQVAPYITAEPPYGLLNEQMPAVSPEQLEQNVLDVIAVLNKAGLTSVYDVGRPPEGDITLLERMSKQEPLNIRVWHTLKYQAYGPDDIPATLELMANNTANSTNDYLGLLGIGEHVYLPMFDLPGVTEPYSDEVVADFQKIAYAAAKHGYQINEHSMMDITIQSILDAYENIDKEIPLAPLNWSLEHVLTISDESIRRAKALGLNLAVHSVAMNMPPKFQPPMRKMQDSGILWGLGTDASIVAHYQPFITLGWAITGKSINGKLINENSVTREEALIAHTRSNAIILRKGTDLGSLEAGKLADLVVLDKDYMTVPEEEIFTIQPLMTVVGGRVVYDSPD